MGSLILIAVVWTFNRSRLRGWRQYGAIAVSVVVASGIGCVLTVAYETDGTLIVDDRHSSLVGVALLIGAIWLRYALIGMLIAGAWLYIRAEADYTAALARCAIESARSDQQTAEARLQMLEAQIEPHFLFNTLAHVKRFYDTSPADGRRMLTNLMEYLAVALPQMREAESTLGRELAHAAAYLDIQKVRMGSRLAIDIEVPEALRSAPMPSLMILTLVENAIKHGIGPQPGGGRIAIRASAHEDRIKIEVADTGKGFAAASGAGTGLANIRGRLRGTLRQRRLAVAHTQYAPRRDCHDRPPASCQRAAEHGMSAAVLARMDSLVRIGSLAADALRSITSRQLRITLLLGIAWYVLTILIEWIHVFPLKDWTGKIREIANFEIGALCLLVAVAIADRAIDEGASRRMAYVVAALAGCVAGVLMERTIVDWMWSAIFEQDPFGQDPVKPSLSALTALERARTPFTRQFTG